MQSSLHTVLVITCQLTSTMKSIGIIICVLFVASLIEAKSLEQKQRSSLQENTNKDPTPVLISKAGYSQETHTVTTEDGYILAMHRIPSGKLNSSLATTLANCGGPPMQRPVVFLQHGLMGSSIDWVLTGPEKGLAFILADAGYDVWMGNFRGTVYSRAHTHLDPSHFDFWKFSWDEMAKHDLPEMLNYVMTSSGQEKIFYVGYSMGTTTFMAMASIHPTLQDNIIQANLLAPVAYVDNIKGVLKLIAPLEDKMHRFTDKHRWGEFVAEHGYIDWFASHLCGHFRVNEKLCSDLYFLVCGFDSQQFNLSLVDTMMEHHNPSGASTYTILHYAQEFNSGRFQAFDFGSAEQNVANYGTSTPPKYNVSKVTAPVALYYGKNDWLATHQDVEERLVPELQNLILKYEVPFAKFNHLDFQYAIDVVPLLYNELLRQMENKRLEVFGHHQHY